ncbi:MAG: hypothetical protein J6S60_07175 [Oscillospiraceae bacterium]|nr:hypothetical protein [Oscillospiraceae bacterium]
MRILRVFPTQTSYTPTDDLAFVGPPPMQCFIPEHDEVHISCTFTWDMNKAEDLAFQWEGVTNKPVKLGGPAYHSEVEGFTPGLYVKKGVIFTSRGCNNNCPWCGVRQIEGKLVELPITQGNIIQDNNFLQCSVRHKEKVFDMLRSQHRICFRGGLETDLIDDHFVSNITSLRIAELWLACDTDAQLPRFKAACKKLTDAGYNRNQIRCYSLIGKDMEAEEQRNREIFRAGAMPFSQLLRDFSRKKTEYSAEWKAFERQWQRPAATVAHMREVERGEKQLCFE